MGGFKMFSIESSFEQHKEDTAEQIQLVSDSVRVVDQKTDFIIEELRQMRLGLVENAFQQHKEETASQIQSLKESIQALEQKTDLILDELRQLRECPKDLMAPVEAAHTTTNAVAATTTLTSNESSNSVMAELTLEGIKQFYVNVDREQWKEATLCDLQKNLLINKNVVVFVNTQDKAKRLTDVLRDQNNIPALTIYGGMEQHTREDIMRQFRSGSLPMLISTDDILAPGLDIHHRQISLVINYDLPTSPEKYLHRVGQSAWLKRKGFAINFMTHDDEKMIFDVQSFYNVVIEELPKEVDDLIYDKRP